MKKPEKKDINANLCTSKEVLVMQGYNQACDDWERFLPDVEEIISIFRGMDLMGDAEWNVEMEKYELYPNDLKSIAQAIAKRIGKED